MNEMHNIYSCQNEKIPDNLSILNLTFDHNVLQKNGLIKQLLRDVDWGGLDLLLVDTPPGSLSRTRPYEPEKSGSDLSSGCKKRGSRSGYA